MIDIRRMPMSRPGVDELAKVTQRFDEAVHAASKRSAAQLKVRLASAPRLPGKIEVTTVVFVRNADVVAAVRLRARGRCEHCRERAPFVTRKDRSPYLEVHHRVRLADGGYDTVENALALCPNCHRAAHYG